MNRNDLLRIIAKKHNMRVGQTEAVIVSILNEINNALLTGEDVYFAGFGRFVVRAQKARSVKIPSGTLVAVPEKKVIRFLPSVDMKRKLNEES